MQSKRGSFWPALVLFFLAPVVGELLSGSAPPAEFFNPFALLLLGILYGGGAILVRELRVRWNKGWPTVFCLGAAYGILEEGLMVKSFFDPAWIDLGILGVYGRWAGVNWVWSLLLTLYHAVVSIAIPILLVELIFPDRREERWLGRRGMVVLSLLLLADVAVGFFLLTTYRPPLGIYLVAVALTAGLIALARQLPRHWDQPTGAAVPVPRPLWFAAVGFGAVLAFYVAMGALPGLGAPVLLAILATVALPVLVTWLVRRLSRSGGWTDQHRLALAGGALGFFVLLAPLQELDATRTDKTSGMTLVGVAALGFLIWMWLRVRRVTRQQQPSLVDEVHV
jgi:hypothetical protein